MKAICECGTASLELDCERSQLSDVVYDALMRHRSARWHDAHVMDSGAQVYAYVIDSGHKSFSVSS